MASCREDPSPRPSPRNGEREKSCGLLNCVATNTARGRFPGPVPTGLSHDRRGAVLVVALVLLVLATLICGVLMKTGLAESRLVRHQAQELQAAWLVESGVERAAAKLAESRDYAGETWNLPAETIGGEWPATVLITIVKPQDESPRRTVRVRADYPPDERWRVRHSKEVVVRLKTQTKPPGNSGAEP